MLLKILLGWSKRGVQVTGKDGYHWQVPRLYYDRKICMSVLLPLYSVKDKVRGVKVTYNTSRIGCRTLPTIPVLRYTKGVMGSDRLNGSLDLLGLISIYTFWDPKLNFSLNDIILRSIISLLHSGRTFLGGKLPTFRTNLRKNLRLNKDCKLRKLSEEL